MKKKKDTQFMKLRRLLAKTDYELEKEKSSLKKGHFASAEPKK